MYLFISAPERKLLAYRTRANAIKKNTKPNTVVSVKAVLFFKYLQRLLKVVMI